MIPVWTNTPLDNASCLDKQASFQCFLSGQTSLLTMLLVWTTSSLPFIIRHQVIASLPLQQTTYTIKNTGNEVWGQGILALLPIDKMTTAQ